MAPTPALGQELATLERVIIDQVAEGKYHFKARNLSKHVPQNTRWVGQSLPMLQEHSERLALERWGGSSGCLIWYIRFIEDVESDAS